MKLLVLTDHKTHGAAESIYPLLKAMAAARPRDIVTVATRSSAANARFFDGTDSVRSIEVLRVDESFAYDESGSWYDRPGVIVADIEQEFDAVFLRVDREERNEHHVSPEPFLRSLARRFPGLPFANDPLGIIETGSKLFLLNFPDLCPSTHLCSSFEVAVELARKAEIVLKPIHGYGGKGILRMNDERAIMENSRVSWDQAREEFQWNVDAAGGMMAVEFLRNVHKGDKRIVVVNGRTLGATLRTPAPGDWRGNVSVGASAEPAALRPEEEKIVDQVTRKLLPHGVPIFGIDTLEGNDGRRRLSEINTLNVGGLVQAQMVGITDVIDAASDELWSYFDQAVRRTFL